MPPRPGLCALAGKLLSKPVCDLVRMSDIEMALVRDAVWSAVQEFRLPHESDLVDRLYDEFGHQPFSILLPSSAAAQRGDAPLFERGRSVLESIVGRFLISGEWQQWASDSPRELRGAVEPLAMLEPNEAPEPGRQPQETKPPPPPDTWDGWD